MYAMSKKMASKEKGYRTNDRGGGTSSVSLVDEHVPAYELHELKTVFQASISKPRVERQK